MALIELLVSLAHDHGKTVVTSIHKPSGAMFHKFDKVLFLADGCVVYYGTPSESLVYCDRLSFKCPEGYNAADHWMDLLVEDSAIDADRHGDAVDGEGDEEESVGLVNRAFPISLDRQEGYNDGVDLPKTTSGVTPLKMLTIASQCCPCHSVSPDGIDDGSEALALAADLDKRLLSPLCVLDCVACVVDFVAYLT